MKRIAEHFPSLSIPDLAKRAPHVGVSWTKEGEGTLGGGRVEFHDDFVQISYELEEDWRKTADVDICTIPGIRGVRMRFKCPRCGENAGVIYYVEMIWACRRCHDLSYLSQYQTKDAKLRSEYYQIKLLTERGRPARMRTSTWAELWRRRSELELQLRHAPPQPTRNDLDQEPVRTAYVRLGQEG